MRKHWFDLLSPGGQVARLADKIDEQVDRLDVVVKRFDRLSSRTRTLTLVVVAVVLTIASFAVGAITMGVIAWAARR